MVFDVGAVDMTYVTAANAAIFPENNENDVEEVAKLLNFSPSIMNKKVCLKPNPLY